jgi:hypothetical protein
VARPRRKAQNFLHAAEEIVDASGVDELLSGCRGKRGPMGQLSLRTFLVGFILNSLIVRSPNFEWIHDTLIHELDPAARLRLGVDVAHPDGSVRQVTYRQVEHLWDRLIDAIDPTPVKSPRGADLSDRAAFHAANQLPPEEAAAKRALRQKFCDLMLEASVPAAYKDHGVYAIDWTDIDSWAEQPKKGPEGSADPTAAWGHRGNKGPSSQRGEPFFGYVAQAITMAAHPGRQTVPDFVRRLQLAPANVNIVPAGEVAVSEALDAGVPIDHLKADSAYPYKNGWTASMGELGVGLTVQLHPNLSGLRGEHKGALCVDGDLYCPMIPENLTELPIRKVDETAEEARDLRKMYDERTPYRFGLLNSPDEDGSMRVRCPAAAGKVRCPHKPDSMQLPYELDEIFDPPPIETPCCRQATITVPVTINPKTRQAYPYGGSAWEASFAGRTAVERTFSRLKDDTGQGFEKGAFRGLGETKMLVALTLALVAQNIILQHERDGSVRDGARPGDDGLTTLPYRHSNPRAKRRPTYADVISGERSSRRRRRASR